MLGTHKTVSNVENCLKKVPQSYSKDGLIRYNDSVMFANKKTNAWLSMDVGKRIEGVEETYQLTSTTQCDGPCARNVFVVKKFEEIDLFGKSDVLLFG